MAPIEVVEKKERKRNRSNCLCFPFPSSVVHLGLFVSRIPSLHPFRVFEAPHSAVYEPPAHGNEQRGPPTPSSYPSTAAAAPASRRDKPQCHPVVSSRRRGSRKDTTWLLSWLCLSKLRGVECARRFVLGSMCTLGPRPPRGAVLTLCARSFPHCQASPHSRQPFARRGSVCGRR